MKKFLNSITFIIFMTATSLFAQSGVGINTTEIAPGSALQIHSTKGSLVLPRMDNEQMMNINDVLDGAVVFNTTSQNLFIRIDGNWMPYTYNDTPSIILNKQNETLKLSEVPLPIPLTSGNIIQNAPEYYQTIDEEITPPENSTIKILREGLYLITAGMSTTNLPPGPKKYKILLFVNGSLVSYLTSGNVNLSGSDFWGSSGNSPVLLKANDIVQVKYVLDGTGEINGKFFNIGISKL